MQSRVVVKGIEGPQLETTDLERGDYFVFCGEASLKRVIVISSSGDVQYQDVAADLLPITVGAARNSTVYLVDVEFTYSPAQQEIQ